MMKCIHACMFSDWFDSLPSLTPDKVVVEKDEWKEIGEANGYTLISHKPREFRWRCKNGHEFTTTSIWPIRNLKSPCKKCRQPTTTDAKEVGLKYDLVLVEHVKERIYVWRCKNGHEFKRPLNEKILQRECVECRMQRHLQNAINKIVERGGTIVKIGEHHGVNTEITFRCVTGHTFTYMAGQIERGAYCKECSLDNSRVGMDPFIKYAKDNDGECLSTEYVGIEFPIAFRCKNGHEFQATPKNIRRRKDFCVLCSHHVRNKVKENRLKQMNEKRAKARKAKREERMRRAKEHAERKGGSVVWVEKHRVMWRCSEGHEWVGSIGKEVSNDIWCVKCRYKQFYRQDEVARVLEEHYGNGFEQGRRPRWLKNPTTGYPLELDFYNRRLGIAIEVNGRQHYEFAPPFHKCMEDLEYTIAKDRLKAERCKERGIILIIVPYTVQPADLEEFVCKQVDKAIEEAKMANQADFW